MRRISFPKERDRPNIQKLTQKLNIVLSVNVIDRLAKYVELVADWNKKMNLTAATQADALLEILLVDAVVLSDSSRIPICARVIDIGSGSGAPAIPLYLIRNDLSLLLVEPKQKRVAFLNTVIGTLQLDSSVSVCKKRVDLRHPQIEGEPFDVAISRATFIPEVWIKVGTKLSNRTILLTSKGRPPDPPKGVVIREKHSYRLPKSTAQRQLVIYDQEPSFLTG